MLHLKTLLNIQNNNYLETQYCFIIFFKENKGFYIYFFSEAPPSKNFWIRPWLAHNDHSFGVPRVVIKHKFDSMSLKY